MKTSTAALPAIPSNSPILPGAVPNCNKWYKITSGDTCNVVATKNGIIVAQLRSWNTEINTSCSNLWLDYYICVGVPGTASAPTTTTTPPAPSNSPVLLGAVSNCNKWRKIGSGDTCDIVAGKNAITRRPATPLEHSDQLQGCNNLLLGYYACVGAPGAATPMPGIVSSCNRYYQIVSGDSYDVIAQKRKPML
ncbi:LysM domain-containing protein [Colletotrichum incanum]|nr:LysM domain-containing protein [Colletotrichum incanum]